MALKYVLTAYNSRRDTNGNCYWAFSYRDVATDRQVHGTVSGGQSNIEGIRMYLNGGAWPPLGDYHWTVIELPIREFNRMTKDWPHAGCAPEDLAAWILSQLAAQRWT